MSSRKVNVKGRGEVVGTDVAFHIVEDGAVTLELDDGVRLRLKPIVVNVIASEPGPNGEREYFVQCINQVLYANTDKRDGR